MLFTKCNCIKSSVRLIGSLVDKNDDRCVDSLTDDMRDHIEMINNHRNSLVHGDPHFKDKLDVSEMTQVNHSWHQLIHQFSSKRFNEYILSEDVERMRILKQEFS